MATATEELEQRLRDQLTELRSSYEDTLIAPTTTRQATTSTLLVFEVGPAALAMSVGRLVEVIRPEGIVAVPCAPEHVAGAITHRQEIVTVLNMRSLLGISEGRRKEGQWALVVRPRSELRALLVDAVIGVHKVPRQSLDTASRGEGDASFIFGNAVVDGRSVALLNVENLSSVMSA